MSHVCEHYKHVPICDSELTASRMDPPVGSGRVTILTDFGWSGQHHGYYSVFTDNFMVPKSICIFE